MQFFNIARLLLRFSLEVLFGVNAILVFILYTYSIVLVVSMKRRSFAFELNAMHTAVHVRIRYNMHKILQYANVTNGSISMQLPLLLKN